MVFVIFVFLLEFAKKALNKIFGDYGIRHRFVPFPGYEFDPSIARFVEIADSLRGPLIDAQRSLAENARIIDFDLSKDVLLSKTLNSKFIIL